MSTTGPSSGTKSTYRFSQPGGPEIESGEFANDDEAEAHARGLPIAVESPVLIERRGHVDWEYVNEVDERP